MFHCSVIMHCFQKLVSDLGTFLQLFLQLFCGACSQSGELASIMRKGRNFPNYQLMLIPFIDCKLKKRCPREGMQCLCVHTLVQTQYQFLFVHSWRNMPKGSIWNQLLKTMHYNRTMKHSYGTKFIPITLYTPLLSITTIWMSSVKVVKSY